MTLLRYAIHSYDTKGYFAAQLLIPVSGRVHLKGRGLLDPTWVQGTVADPAGYQ